MLHSTTASAALAVGAALLSAQSLVTLAQGAELSAAGLAYTPTIEKCPSGFSLVRQLSTNASKQTLSAGEQAYIEARDDLLPEAWETYLQNVIETGVTLPEYVSGFLESGCSDTLPRFAIATSGGGYRAAIFGAGVLNTLDARSSNKTGLNGLLQAATYLAGLSGGSWLVGSLVQANFPPIPDLIFGPSSNYSLPISNDAYSGWLPEYDLTAPSGNTTVDEEYIEVILGEIAGKYALGFPVTVNDFYARTLARHFVNGTTATDLVTLANATTGTFGAGITWSGLTSLPSIKSHYAPFPIVISDLYSAAGNESNVISEYGNYIPLTNPILEYNLYEMGSWDPMVSAFIPTEYLGTTNDTLCVQNYDQAAFIMGISSDLFNEYNISAAYLDSTSIYPIIEAIEETYPSSGIIIDGTAIPNPFYGLNSGTFIESDQKYLTPVDGGENGENVPFQPLLVKARQVDVIFAIDASNDIEAFANGEAVVATSNRTTFFPSSYSFPSVPWNYTTWDEEGLATRPTFFGCNESSSSDAPLVIYLANGAPPRVNPVPLTNTSTTQDVYSTSEIAAMLAQAQEIATQGVPTGADGGVDPEWPACLACAIVDRVRSREGIARSGVCESCLDRYCWS